MIHLVLLIHAHQPIGNFDQVIEEAYRLAYLPFLELLEQHPKIALSLHYSGILLEWIERRRPEYFDRLRRLVQQGQVELVGGGYYEPILTSIPDADKRAQLGKMVAYLETRFGARPRGIWLTERVWEPGLPGPLAEAGVEFTLTDDTHFLSAGLEPEQLYGDYLTESAGSAVRVIPGLKDLRYLIPFRDVRETVEYCRRAAAARPGGLVAMGDDLEKFGNWPETHQHCYVNGWLERFFTALEAESEWLRAVRASDYLENHPPLGRIYLPTASYHEMMEWALPLRAGQAYERARRRAQELPGGSEIARFLAGGQWNNFFHKYSEANLLHKRMLWVSRRLARLREKGLPVSGTYEHLLAAQCNDAYWHGVFGGLYAPHLRHALYAHLLAADREADALEGFSNHVPARVSTADFDVDGQPEMVVESNSLFAVLDPGDGATLPEIDFKPAAVNVVNALMRRAEAYHSKLTSRAAAVGAARSIHDRVRAKEEGLERELRYDRYERACFRAYVFSPRKTFEDFRALGLEENPAFAAGAYAADPATLECTRQDAGLELHKKFRLDEDRLRCALRLAGAGGPTAVGLELVFNLMAPNAHDRYFQRPGFRESLRWAGELEPGEELWIRDEWLRVAIHVTAKPAARWWIAPIHTVSQSEEGFEKVYQGSAILPVWTLDLGQEPFEAELSVRIM